MSKVLEFLGNLWLGFGILGAIAGMLLPFVFVAVALYEILK